MAYLAVRNDVIRPNKVQIVDICTRNEFVDIDRPGRLQRDVVEFVFGDLDIAVVVDLVALHNIFVVDFFAGVGINLKVFDAMSGLAIYLVKADLFAVRCRWKQRNRTCDQRKAQEALPICTRGHDKYSTTQLTGLFKLPERPFYSTKLAPIRCKPSGCGLSPAPSLLLPCADTLFVGGLSGRSWPVLGGPNRRRSFGERIAGPNEMVCAWVFRRSSL